jgi:hypothetical protein
VHARSGAARARVALCVAGLARGGEEGLGLLEESAAAVQGSPALPATSSKPLAPAHAAHGAPVSKR